ncbi:gp58-like family protein [Carnobacterium maltaromaticum]|uniref:gp58-like family protein n=1 Tax=Carnobacterium maltaromaticum TaxID=2751 RepID=UPI001E4D0764|nr:gp58-like family protein [Carnobacterium maltaromaticum]
MLKASADFMSAIKSDVREIHARITINNQVFGNADLLTVNYDSGSLSGETFGIGSTFSNSVKINFSHLVEGLKELDEVSLEIGIRLPNNSIEFVPLGIFIINDKIQMDRNNNKTSIECMDRMIMLGGAYESKLSYPAEIRQVALEIANLAGVEVNDNFDRLMSDRISKPQGYTFRQAIGLIAQFHAGFATFDRYGKLEIRTLADTEYKILPANYMSKGLTKNEMMFRLGGISVKTGDEETSILTIGATAGSQINLENRVMTRELLAKIYEKIRNINYYPFSLKWRGDPSLESGDWVAITDLEGNIFKTPNLAYSINFNGGMNATSTADTQTQSDATYQYKGSLQQQIEFLNNRIGAAGNQIYEGLDEPINPRENDMWFKPNGPDMEIWIYSIDPITGELGWIFKVSTATNQDLIDAMEEMEQELQNEQSRIDEVIEQADKDRENADFTASNVENISNKVIVIEAQADTAMSQAADAYAKGSQALEDLKNLSVGASNQIPNSFGDIFKNMSGWGNVKFSISQEPIFNSTKPFIIGKHNNYTDPVGTNFGLQNSTATDPYSYVFVKKDQSYVLSFISSTYKADSNMKYVYLMHRNGKGNLALTVGNPKNVEHVQENFAVVNGVTFVRHTLKFKADSDDARAYFLFGSLLTELSTAEDPAWIKIAEMQLEEGNVRTNWKPKSTDIQVEVTRIDGQLTQKVNQTSFDVLSGTVSSQGTLISQNQSELQLKADQSSVDVINNKVEQQASELSVQAGKINGLSTSVSGNTTRIGALELSSSKFEVTISQVQNSIGNLLNNPTATKKNDRWLISQGGEVSLDTIDFNGVQAVAIKSNGTGNQQFVSNKLTIDPSKMYEVSLWFKTDDSNATRYFGLFAKNANGATVPITGVNRNSGATNPDITNPYFLIGLGSTSWKKLTGFIAPAGTNSNDLKGRGVNVDTSFILTPEIATIEIRFLNYPSILNSAMWVVNSSVIEVSADAISQFSNLEIKMNGIQSTVASKAEQSQVTQLANQWASTVTSMNTISDNLDIKSLMAVGLTLHTDPTFDQGNNDVQVYNNSSNGNVTIVRQDTSGTGFTNPSGSRGRLMITHKGPASPNLGGFSFRDMSRSNQKILYRFIAYLPAGYTFSWSSNAIGTGGTAKWLTSTAGTGNWTEYALLMSAGATGSFASTGFFSIVGGGTPTEASPLIWYLDTATSYDLSATAQSQITQLATNINLKVSKNDVITQINLSSESDTILIQASRIHLSGTSKIDNAVIKSAMIDSITANQITAGTLNAALINVINLNANNITSGIITGARTTINLSTGEIKIGGNTQTITLSSGGMELINSYNERAGWLGIGYSTANPTVSNGMLIGIEKGKNFTIGVRNTLGSGPYSDVFAYEGGNDLIKINKPVSNLKIGSVRYVIQKDSGNRLSIEGEYGVHIKYNNSGTLHTLAEFNGSGETKFRSMGGGALDIGSYGVRVWQGLQVYNGAKNAVHITRDGARATPAYETAESYLGDIGTSNTGKNKLVKIDIETLFGDTVNTSEYEYHVFIQNYDKASIWVSEREPDYFIVKSDIENSSFAWEVKAKRRGYEKDRLVLQEDITNEEIQEHYKESK